MELKSIIVRNYRSLQNIELKDIPKFLVVVGANGTGKSSFFDVFGFLRDALVGNVRQALDARGRYAEAVTRGHERESMFFELQVRTPIAGRRRLVTCGIEMARAEWVGSETEVSQVS
ncbi:MAG: AAA family ATPase [Bryobacteraceae bacterium]